MWMWGVLVKLFPNFVHSLDAAHMFLTILKMHEAGIRLLHDPWFLRVSPKPCWHYVWNHKRNIWEIHCENQLEKFKTEVESQIGITHQMYLKGVWILIKFYLRTFLCVEDNDTLTSFNEGDIEHGIEYATNIALEGHATTIEFSFMSKELMQIFANNLFQVWVSKEVRKITTWNLHLMFL